MTSHLFFFLRRYSLSGLVFVVKRKITGHWKLFASYYWYDIQSCIFCMCNTEWIFYLEPRGLIVLIHIRYRSVITSSLVPQSEKKSFRLLWIKFLSRATTIFLTMWCVNSLLVTPAGMLKWIWHWKRFSLEVINSLIEWACAWLVLR